MTETSVPLGLVKDRLRLEGIEAEVEVKEYPDEFIVVVRVQRAALQRAIQIGNDLDAELTARKLKGFVVVRDSGAASGASSRKDMPHGVRDPRAAQLAALLAARARASEQQPSLVYVPDAANNVHTICTTRHHLIFGRRGTGKTALMLEAKRTIESQNDVAVWINLQSLRAFTPVHAFMAILGNLAEKLETCYARDPRSAVLLTSLTRLRDKASITGDRDPKSQARQQLVHQARTTISRFCETTQAKVFVFLDDFHYFPRALQPDLLDLLHGAVRDSNAWLKVASIRHLSKWFRPHPPTGLQSGHDADHVDLDVTLENPSAAKEFLEKLLKTFAEHTGIRALSRLLPADSLDRLVLACGAVPRDYLTLTAEAIREATKRGNARLVGVQDVNNAAGRAAQIKITELEDDAASSGLETQRILRSVQTLRQYCLNDERCTFFRVDFRDKEAETESYSLLQGVMDLRLVHLVNPSVSDKREGGRRAEVYMLDLSQFSGQRLKQRLKVLDFSGGNLAEKITGSPTKTKVGNTPKRLQEILRRAPQFDLSRLALTAGE